MLDLSSLPRRAFSSGLEYNLRHFGSLPKVYDHFLSATKRHLDADAAWLRRFVHESRLVSEDHDVGRARQRDAALVEAFFRNERPALPKNLLLAPLRLNGRSVGLVGVERHRRDFDRGQGWELNRLTSILASDLAHREEVRLTRVLDSIKEKVVAELRPRDLAYQILDGLYQLLHYDHSAALLIYEPDRSTLRVDAEKIAWTKTKSAFVGHELTLSEDVRRALASERSVLTTPNNGDDRALFDLLYFHRGASIPEPSSMLCAPLYFDSELLGVLKLAALKRLPFDARDRDVAKRFLPAAAVALRNARERTSWENQAMQAEIRAGLVTLARAVAHDVNNAMGTLLPLAEQVRDDLREGRAEARTLVEDMDVVIDKARLCTRIFANMLKLGSRTTRQGRGPVDVHAVVTEMMPVLCSPGKASGVAIELDFEHGFPVIRFSRAHLERIVWNLVTNAAEAVADGGSVFIRTRRDEQGAPSLIVEDDGPGMPADELAKAMEPFFTTKEKGNGLGLSICRALAWQYGGQLHLESRPGAGTSAVLSLPREGESE